MAKKTENKHPFPFYGAGDAQYYEWAEVIVRFIKEPTKDQIKKITTLAPSPIKPEKEDFRGKMLIAGGGQFINMDIHEKYDGSATPKSAGEDFGDKETTTMFYSSEKALKAFNEHIEKWLLEIHTFCPIQFACRMEDGEAGGTELSDWHKKSIKWTKSLIKELTKNKNTFTQKGEEKELFKHSLQGIFAFSKIKPSQIPSQLLDFTSPIHKIDLLFKKGKVKDIIKFINKNQKEDEFRNEVSDYLGEIKTENKKERTIFLALTKELLQSKITFLEEDADLIARIAKAAIIDKNSKLIDLLKKTTSDKKASPIYINTIGFQAYEAQQEKKHIKIAIQLYELALGIKVKTITTDLHLSTYCNALWVLQNDNTGLPVNQKLNQAFLEKCLPFGPKNPAIYFNALCLYVEMNDLDQAFTCLKFVKKYEFKFINEGEYDMLIKQLKTEKLFIKLRHDVRYKEIEKTL